MQTSTPSVKQAKLSRRNLIIALVIGAAIIVSGYAIYATRAAGFFAAVEADTATASGKVTTVADTGASSGKAVEFGLTTTTTPPPTTPPPATGGYPGAHNTGVPRGLPGDTRAKVIDDPTKLPLYTGPMTITQDGTVIDGVYINNRGILVINAKNVVIKNSLIRIDNSEGSPNKEAVRTYNDSANLLIQDTEITGANEQGQPTDSSGGGQPLVSRTGYTLLRVNAHDYGDILRIDGRATVQDSWLHDPRNKAGADPHNDVIQSTNATYIRILHNRLELNATQTSLILLKADIGTISDVKVDNNLFNGGGYSVYWYDANHKISNGSFTNNRWQRSPTGGFMPKGGYHGTHAINASTMPVWTNNVWDDTGQVIPL